MTIQIETQINSLLHNVVPRKYRSNIDNKDTSLASDLGLDSMAMVSFAFMLEEEFNISLIDVLGERITEIHTVGDIHKVVHEIFDNVDS